MDTVKPIDELTTSLEELLVREFRSLETLVALTKQERQLLSEGDEQQIMRVVEEKEVILDALGLAEDSRRMVTDQIATSLGLGSTCTLNEVIQHLKPPLSDRLARVSEGVSALVNDARDLNVANRAISLSRLDWLDAAQGYLLSFFNTLDTYTPPGVRPSVPSTSVGGIDHKA